MNTDFIMRLVKTRRPENLGLAREMIKGAISRGELHPGWLGKTRLCSVFVFEKMALCRCQARMTCPNCKRDYCTDHLFRMGPNGTCWGCDNDLLPF